MVLYALVFYILMLIGATIDDISLICGKHGLFLFSTVHVASMPAERSHPFAYTTFARSSFSRNHMTSVLDG